MENKFTNFLGDGTQNIIQSCYDNFVESNAKVRSKAGLKSTITRMMLGECCAWCAAIAGTYEYGREPKDIYRRHKNCDCVVIYKSEKGTYQDSHTKKEFENRRQVIDEITKTAAKINKIADPVKLERELEAKLRAEVTQDLTPEELEEKLLAEIKAKRKRKRLKPE